MASTESAGISISVPWDRLRAWVDEQAAAEAQTGQSQVSKTQLAALSHIIPFADEEPDVSDADHVSKLMFVIQSRHLSPPTFVNLDPILVPIVGVLYPRFRTICTLGFCDRDFPCEGFGFDAGQEAPLFQSKKNAKQFAAKQAVAFLLGDQPTSNSRATGSPAGGASVNAQTPPSILQSHKNSLVRDEPNRSQKRPFTQDEPSAPPSLALPQPPSHSTSLGSLTVTETNSSHSPAMRNSPIPSPIPNDTEPNSVAARVAALLNKQRHGPVAYLTEPDLNTPDRFNGRAVFKPGARIPNGLGIVQGAESQKQAKLQLAEQVLAWLEAEEERRQKTFDELFGPR